MRVFILLSLLVSGCGGEYDPRQDHKSTSTPSAAATSTVEDPLKEIRANIQALQQENLTLKLDLAALKEEVHTLEYQLQDVTKQVGSGGRQ